MPIEIPRDLEQLRAKVATKLKGCGASYQDAANRVVQELNDLWDTHDQGLPLQTSDMLNRALSPIFDSLLDAATPQEGRTRTDELVRTWRAVSAQIRLP